MCLGTIEDAVGSDSFPEVFVDVVICTAADKKTTHRRVGPRYLFDSGRTLEQHCSLRQLVIMRGLGKEKHVKSSTTIQ